MVHEATGLWHGAGFSVSRWLMIIIHGYRATTLLLSILLNVLVRTAGEYRYDTVLGFLATFVSLSTTSRPPLSLSLSRVFAFRSMELFRRFAHGGESIPRYTALVIVALPRSK